MTDGRKHPVTRSLILAPDFSELAGARDFVAQVAREAGFADSRVFDIVLVSSEAAANAIEHSPVSGQVRVTTLLYADRLELQVAGPGEFQTPDRLKESHSSRGLGLPLMAKLSDHVALYSGTRGGTLVSLTFYLPGAARESESEALPPSVRELIEGNELISAIAANAPVGIYVLDPDLRFRWANQALHSFLEKPHRSADLAGLYYADVIPEAEASGLLAILRDISQKGVRHTEEEFEFAGFQRGTTYWHWDALPLTQERDAPPYDILVVVSDVTERRQAEDSLRRSEEKYQALIEANADFVWETDAQGRYTYCSPQMETLWGIKPENMLGRTPFELIPEPYGEAATGQFAEVTRVPASFSGLECVSYDGRGNQIVVEISGVPILDVTGAVLGFRGVTRDVTERKRAQSRLERDKRLLQGAADILEEALSGRSEEELGLVCLEVAQEVTDSRIGFVGEVGADGLLHDIAVSNPGWEACAALGRHGERRPQGDFAIRGLYGQVLADGESLCANQPSAHAASAGLPKGHPPVDAFLGVPLKRDDKTIGMVAVANRVGGYGPEQTEILESLSSVIVEAFEFKRAQDIISDREQRFRLMLENSRDVIYCANLQSGRYEYISPSVTRLVGYTPGELMAQDLEVSAATVHPEDLPAVREAQEEADRAGEAEAEYRQRTKSGEYRWVSNRFSVMRDEAGRPLHRIGSIRDVTPGKQREDEFRAIAAENERLYRQQLDIAESLQQALLNIPAEIGRFKVGHLYRSATEAARVGGDFYDVFEVRGGLVGVLVGDVAGHGIAAARTATLVKDVVHAFTHQSVRTQEVLRRTNALLIEKELPGFVSLFLGIMDDETGTFRYSSAGHPETFLRRATGEVERLGTGSAPLGVFPEASWRPGAVDLSHGDLLLLYTDGVTEARRGGELFGERRLERLLKRKRVSAGRLPHLIIDQVLAFSDGALQDDIAVLALALTEARGDEAKSKHGFRQERLLG